MGPSRRHALANYVWPASQVLGCVRDSLSDRILLRRRMVACIALREEIIAGLRPEAGVGTYPHRPATTRPGRIGSRGARPRLEPTPLGKAARYV
jgi:hypothetical protein